MFFASSSKLSTLLLALVLSVHAAQAIMILTQDNLYEQLCGPNATSSGKSAICIDADSDIRQHIKGASPNVVFYLANDRKRFAVPVLPVGEKLWFTTVEHKVSLEAVTSGQNMCVAYSVGTLQGTVNEASIYCVGEQHVHLPQTSATFGLHLVPFRHQSHIPLTSFHTLWLCEEPSDLDYSNALRRVFQLALIRD